MKPFIQRSHTDEINTNGLIALMVWFFRKRACYDFVGWYYGNPFFTTPGRFSFIEFWG